MAQAHSSSQSQMQVTGTVMVSTPAPVSNSSNNDMYSNSQHLQQHFLPPPHQLGIGGQQDHHTSGQLTQLLPPPPHHHPQTNDVYIRHPVVEVETVVSLEQCCVCSTFFEAPSRPIPHPDLNRMICKVLDVSPEVAFYKECLSLCVNCTNLLRKFDRLRVELEFVKTQLVTYVMESLTQIRVDGGSQLDGLKAQIIERWTSGQKDGRKKGKWNEGYAASGNSGDLSWAAHNNIMKNSTVVAPTAAIKTWPLESEIAASSQSSAPIEYPSDNDNDGDDLLHNANSSDNDGEFVAEHGQGVDVKNGNDMEADIVAGTQVSEVPAVPKRKYKKKSKKKKSGEGVAPLICTNCGRIFSQRVSYNGHTQVCVSDDLNMPKNCSICSDEHNVPWLFETWEDLKSHVDSCHPFVKLETCAVCRVNFLPNGIKQHKCSQPYGGQVDKEAIFKCDRCDRAYNTRANLVDHVRRIHKDEQHKCDICNKVYGSPMLLGFHVKRHKRVVSKFQCKHCGICLTTNYGLKEHTKVHTKEQPYDCKECGRKFTSLSILRCHKMVHNNKKPHVCHICGVGFKIKSTLSRHVGRHQLNETNYTKKCPLCPKTIFRKVWILKKHMETEHGGSAEFDEVFEKYKDIDDAPKIKNASRSIKKEGRKRPLQNTTKKGIVETDDEEEFQDDGMSEDEMSDQADVKPRVDGGESSNEDSVAATSTSSATPSRQSARLMGKSKKTRIVVLLTKESAGKNSKHSSGK